MEEKKTEKGNARVCPKDCRMCGMAQQIYCATHLSFTSFDAMNKIWTKLEEIEGQIKAIQSAENGFLSPLTRENVADDKAPTS